MINSKYKYAIIGKHKYIDYGSNCYIKYNKYVTLESAEQALIDMKKSDFNNDLDIMIVDYFIEHVYIMNIKNKRKLKFKNLKIS